MVPLMTFLAVILGPLGLIISLALFGLAGLWIFAALFVICCLLGLVHRSDF